MGAVGSRELIAMSFPFGKRKIDEACSNTSLSKLRYVAVEKPKWKVFSKRELRPLTTYPQGGRKRCPCGATGPCKQKITPNGVVLHYPQRNKIFDKKYKPPKIEKAFLSDTNRVVNKVKIVRPNKFGVPVPSLPAWRVDKMISSPFQRKLAASIEKRRKRRNQHNAKPEDTDTENTDTENTSDEEEKKK